MPGVIKQSNGESKGVKADGYNWKYGNIDDLKIISSPFWLKENADSLIWTSYTTEGSFACDGEITLGD